ncbi:MAG: hypothetical protein A2096_00375 [Spirochaetes bacterium GWF1_41_5]|nr:MAG: hypothetical protein A2096_00375 [Spirochaetes bacterium GWF1_41_5]
MPGRLLLFLPAVFLSCSLTRLKPEFKLRQIQIGQIKNSTLDLAIEMEIQNPGYYTIKILRYQAQLDNKGSTMAYAASGETLVLKPGAKINYSLPVKIPAGSLLTAAAQLLFEKKIECVLAGQCLVKVLFITYPCSFSIPVIIDKKFLSGSGRL